MKPQRARPRSHTSDSLELAQPPEAQLVPVHPIVREGERVAYRLLEALIPLLLRSGVAPARLSLMTRRLLIESAAQGARLRNGRINKSQIAAATGLSRAEVSKHLSQWEPGSPNQQPLPSRTARVISAWCTDKRYMEKVGTPRVLPFSGRTGSFTNLVRKHGRDVPPRAMAAEMQRQGLVKIRRNTIVLLASRPISMFTKGRDADEPLRAIDAIVEALVDDTQGASSPLTRYMRITADDAVEQHAIRSRVTDLLNGTLAALTAIKQYRLTGERGRRRKSKYSVSVALAVSERRPDRERYSSRPRTFATPKR
ncbi:MAG: DUF6502 family protein [Steroidobacteraceae bacterium]